MSKSRKRILWISIIAFALILFVNAAFSIAYSRYVDLNTLEYVNVKSFRIFGITLWDNYQYTPSYNGLILKKYNLVTGFNKMVFIDGQTHHLLGTDYADGRHGLSCLAYVQELGKYIEDRKADAIPVIYNMIWKWDNNKINLSDIHRDIENICSAKTDSVIATMPATATKPSE